MKVAPPGLDYRPVLGDMDCLSFGVIQADGGAAGAANTAEGAVFKRMFPICKPADPLAPWTRPTCFMWGVLLPPGASDELWDAQLLARTYDQQGFSLRDLVVIVTLRFPEAEMVPAKLRLHEAWQLTQGFVWSRIVLTYNVGAISTLHVPARSGRPGPPHVHVMVPARELLPTGYGQFVRPLATEEGRLIMEREWSAWRQEYSDG